MSELPSLTQVVDQYGLRAKKALGQNFLLDLNLTRKIARSAGSLEGKTVLEIGPGPGGLTRALLLEGADKVVAIERDERCLDALEEISNAFHGRLEVHADDALTVTEEALGLGDDSADIKIIANLPYNIGTALLLKWIAGTTWPPFYSSLTLMFQKEVAERIVASPGNKSYGRLSVITQWRCYAEIVFDVRRQAFTPPPKVTSSVIHLVPRPEPLFEADLATLEKVVAAAFGQRRKMLRQSLKTIAPDSEELLRLAEIDPTRRAETLSVEEFCAIARAFQQAK